MKFTSYVIYFLLFGVLADVYIGCVVLATAPLAVRWAVSLPTWAAFVSLFLIRCNIRYSDAVRVFSWLMFLFALPKFLFSLLWAVGRGLPGIDASVTRGIALSLGGAVSLFFLILIFFVSRHLKVNARDLSFTTLPAAFDGLRICQLSDFHLGSFGKKSRYVRHVIDTALGLKPDVIFFTGDLVNFATDESLPYREELARLAAPMGIFAIRGNHDYLLHGHPDEQARRDDMERLLSLETGLGWKLLCNAHALLQKNSGTIAVAGVENVSSNPYFTGAGGDLRQALRGLPDSLFTILLSHDPSHWRSEVVPESSVPLTLSGHTHGLRYKLAGLKPAHWRLPQSSGIYTEGRQVLHVSKGLGSAFAFRLGGFPNVDLITLRRTQNG